MAIVDVIVVFDFHSKLFLYKARERATRRARGVGYINQQQLHTYSVSWGINKRRSRGQHRTNDAHLFYCGFLYLNMDQI